jgi:peroxiredoxin
LFVFSGILSANSPEQFFGQSVNKALRTEHISFNVIDKIKFIQADKFMIDTMYVIAKRKKRISFTNAFFRMQYENGNVMLFNGKEYKSLDVDEKTLFVVDTSQDGYYYLRSSGIPQILQKHLAFAENKLTFDNYSYSFLSDTVLDGNKCRQIEILAKVNQRIDAESETKIILDSAVVTISVKDTLLRRYFRRVALDDGNEQIEEQYFTSVRSGIAIDDIVFDISLPEGYSYKRPSTERRKPKLLAVGSDAPKWVLGDDKDREYRLSSYIGKVVVMDFWGTWCKWCRKAMPQIQQMYEMYKDKGVAIFGISCQEPHSSNPREYMESNGIAYQLLVQGDEIAKYYKVKGFPTLYVIDKYGKVAWYFVGYSDNLAEDLKKVIEKELAK